MLETGTHATIAEIAAAEKINASYVGRVLRLTLLAPDIVESILNGRQPTETLAVLEPVSRIVGSAEIDTIALRLVTPKILLTKWVEAIVHGSGIITSAAAYTNSEEARLDPIRSALALGWAAT